MNINIQGKDVELKRSLRSMIFYESLAGKPFEPKQLVDIITYFYSVVMSSERTLTITLDEFVDLLDENPQLLIDFSTWLAHVFALESQLKEVKEDEKKKEDESPKKA